MSNNRTVVVTGGGSGIGRATAKRFGDDGDFVIVADLNTSSAEVVAAEIVASGGQAMPLTVDVAQDDSVATLANKVDEARGVADVLVNSAGLLQNVTSIRNMDIGEHDRGLGGQLSWYLPLLPGIRSAHGQQPHGMYCQYLVDLRGDGLSIDCLWTR